MTYLQASQQRLLLRITQGFLFLIDLTDPSPNLYRLGGFGIGMDLGIKALQERTRERRPGLGRQIKRTSEQVLHVGHQD